MTNYTLIIFLLVSTGFGFSQSEVYLNCIQKADSLYKAQDYKNSALAFTKAFNGNKGQALEKDRYNAACCWSLNEVADSAIYHLQILANENYNHYSHIATDSDLDFLEKDPRWKPILLRVKQNKDFAEQNLRQDLADQLEVVFIDDQKSRKQVQKLNKINAYHKLYQQTVNSLRNSSAIFVS